MDISKYNHAKEVLALQRASYQVEAELIDFYDLPPLKERAVDLQKSGELFFGYYDNEELCGVISIKNFHKWLDIHRLMVHPNHFRKGIAQQLLAFLETKYEEIETIIVATGSKNTPAINFYLRNGFTIRGDVKVIDGLYMTSFAKKFT